MKQLSYIILIAGLLFTVSCSKDETYPEAPKRIFMAAKVALGATTYTNRVAARKTVPDALARVYVNRLFETDVTATFTITGTAVSDVNFTPPASLQVVIPAGSYFGEINFKILNDPAQTAARTVILTLVSATEGYEPGVGTDHVFKDFIYTINP